jgi:hypothetical protein
MVLRVRAAPGLPRLPFVLDHVVVITQESLWNWWHKNGGNQIGIFVPTSFCLICRSNFPESVASRAESPEPFAAKKRKELKATVRSGQRSNGQPGEEGNARFSVQARLTKGSDLIQFRISGRAEQDFVYPGEWKIEGN